MMLQQPTPEDFVLATGETHPVREFVNKSFEAVGITLRFVLPFFMCFFFFLFEIVAIRWEGSGLEEQGIDVKTGKAVVKVDPKYFRPAEVECVFDIYFCFDILKIDHQTHFSSLLLGNPAKAERLLGWKRRVDFDSLVQEMVEADLKAAASLVEDQN